MDLLNTLDTIAKAGAGFRSLADTWVDTTTPHGKLMLTILGGLAEFERSLILARTGEGRTRALARGVKFGRPSTLTQYVSKVSELLDSGFSCRAVSERLTIPLGSVFSLSRKLCSTLSQKRHCLDSIASI